MPLTYPLTLTPLAQGNCGLLVQTDLVLWASEEDPRVLSLLLGMDHNLSHLRHPRAKERLPVRLPSEMRMRVSTRDFLGTVQLLLPEPGWAIKSTKAELVLDSL